MAFGDIFSAISQIATVSLKEAVSQDFRLFFKYKIFHKF